MYDICVYFWLYCCRPNDLDRAILRRMPISIQMPLPNTSARCDIILKQIHIQGEALNTDVDIGWVAEKTAGYTGSDIKELIRQVILQKNKEIIDLVTEAEQFQHHKNTSIIDDNQTNGNSNQGLNYQTNQYDLEIDKILNRLLSKSDFEIALSHSRITGNLFL